MYVYNGKVDLDMKNSSSSSSSMKLITEATLSKDKGDQQQQQQQRNIIDTAAAPEVTSNSSSRDIFQAAVSCFLCKISIFIGRLVLGQGSLCYQFHVSAAAATAASATTVFPI